jgi:5-methylcytosine-specific restriction protein A
MMKPCLSCGTPTSTTRCPACRLPDERPSATERGYDAAWFRLSKRARKLQPFCSDCFTTEDLTTDHTPQAWRRKAEGKPIRLRDVAVVCRSCNTRRGAARGDRARAETQGTGAIETASGPRGKPQRPLHTPGGYPGSGGERQ